MGYSLSRRLRTSCETVLLTAPDANEERGAREVPLVYGNGAAEPTWSMAAAASRAAKKRAMFDVLRVCTDS